MRAPSWLVAGAMLLFGLSDCTPPQCPERGHFSPMRSAAIGALDAVGDEVQILRTREATFARIGGARALTREEHPEGGIDAQEFAAGFRFEYFDVAMFGVEKGMHLIGIAQRKVPSLKELYKDLPDDTWLALVAPKCPALVDGDCANIKNYDGPKVGHTVLVAVPKGKQIRVVRCSGRCPSRCPDHS